MNIILNNIIVSIGYKYKYFRSINPSSIENLKSFFLSGAKKGDFFHFESKPFIKYALSDGTELRAYYDDLKRNEQSQYIIHKIEEMRYNVFLVDAKNGTDLNQIKAVINNTKSKL